MERTKVLIVDDHTIFRRGLAQILGEDKGLDILGQASNGNEAVEKAQELKPDVVVMDLHMPECDGVQATGRLRTEMPEVKVLILTVSDKEEDLFLAIKAGARGYLLKDEEPEQLAQAVGQVARGGVIVSAAMADNLLNEFKAQKPATSAVGDSGLSRREQEVLQLVAQGTSNKEIGAALFISENTVKTHLRHILDTLHLANRSQAAAYAARAGMLKDDPQPRD